MGPMTATTPPPVALTGHTVRLDPFVPADVPGLWRAIGRPEVFAGGWGGGPAALPPDEDAFRAWFNAYVPAARGFLTYVVRPLEGEFAGRIVGTTSAADFDLAREWAHIGWTAYDPAVWGTVVNPDCKLTLLTMLFDHGFGRVKLQADAVNARSRAAIVKLGATFEGVRRRDSLRADGTWRDAAVHSILVDEWPDVRRGLEARVAGGS